MTTQASENHRRPSGAEDRSELGVVPSTHPSTLRAFRSLSMAMVKGFYRDKLSLFFAILFPLFFIVIFGTVFASDNAARPEVIEVGAVPLIDNLPPDARAGFDQAIELVPGTTLDAALEEVRKGEADAVVQQQGDTLLLNFSSADPAGAGAVQGVFSSFVDQANIAVSGVPPTYTLQTQQVEDESLQPIQYIAPGMIGYGIAVGAVFGAALTLISWREKKLLRRLRLAPVSTSVVVGSRVVVSLGVAIGQLILFVGISLLPFLGLQLNGAWYMAVPLVIAGTLAFLAIGLLVGSIAKTAEGGSGLANLITLPMAFLSGAFIPLEAAPAWLLAVSKFMPMGYLVEGMKDVMVRGEGASAALLPIGILLTFAAVVSFIATRVFRWDAA
jgi:ABC-2 type transport system permease protein